MLKSAIAASILLGSVSFASAMPVAPVPAGATLPVIKAAVIIKRVVRRPARRRVIVHKTIIRR